MLVLISLICVVIGLLYYLLELKTSRMKQLTSNMPSPKRYPFIGSALEFGTRSDEILQAYVKIASLGPVTAIWVGPQLYVAVSGIDELQTIFSSNEIIKKAHIYNYLHPWLGPGLLTSDGEEWRKQRKTITPAFHFKILEQFVDIFSPNLDVFIDILKSEVGKKGFDVTEPIALLTLDIISETSMGTKLNTQLQKDNSFVQAINDAAMIILLRSLRPWLDFDFLFNIFPEGRLFNRQCDVIHKLVKKVIEKRRKQRADTKGEISNEEESLALGQKKKAAFLDLLMDNNLTDEEIKNQVNTFMFAGHDTTSSTISFILYCLMKYPEVQEKVYREQLELLGDRDGYATFQDLRNMKYLECVINETLRLYPSVPYVGRTATKDFQLTPEYILPKGCSVTLMIYSLHRDPKVFPDPEIFNPDRFLPENIQGRHPYAFCPFSAGSRNCIGQKFAMLELKSVTSAVIRKFKILPPIDCPDVILGSELVLKSITGIYIRLENR